MNTTQSYNYDPNEYIDKLESYLFKCKANYNSPYNSGYEIVHYKEEIEKTEAKLKKVGRQLKFDF